MATHRPELFLKLNSLVNRYGSDEEFVAHMDEWPRTVKELICGSIKLMIRFKLVESIPDPSEDEMVIIGTA